MTEDTRETIKSLGYEIIEKIGQGSFANVYKVKWDKYPDIEFAAKVIKFDSTGSQRKMSTSNNELMSLKSLDHENIIKIFNSFECGKEIVLIFEYCPNGTIQQKILKEGPLDDVAFVHVASQLLGALYECHKHNLSHRDIKPANILIDEYQRVKLCDFGFANYSLDGELIEQFVGSLPYLPPEILLLKPHDPLKADIWSLGMTLYYLYTGKLPWPRRNKDEMIHYICNGFVYFPDGSNIEICNMIRMMLVKDPLDRPSIGQLLSLPLFHEHRYKPSSSYLPKRASQRRYSFNNQLYSKKLSVSLKNRVAQTYKHMPIPTTFRVDVIYDE